MADWLLECIKWYLKCSANDCDRDGGVDGWPSTSG